jgi:hypothetical protein
MSTLLKDLCIKLSAADKHLHLVCSAALFLALNTLMATSDALYVTAIIGVIKEMYDHFFGSGLCLYDLLANAIGMTCGVIIYYCLW